MAKYTKHWSHRLNGAVLWQECDDRRRELGMTWTEVAEATKCGYGTNFFTRLKQEGSGIHSSSLVSILVWLGRLDWEDPLVLDQPQETEKE